MAKQQTKRRRKRYAPGSAYAGDVRPSGILGLLSSPRTMRIVFIGMAAALVIGALGGGLITFAGFGESGGRNDPNADIVLPGDDSGTPGATVEPTAGEVRQYAAAPAMTIDTTKTYTATIKTSAGDIQIELLPQQAPQTVNNFVFLARDGFYNGLVFHEVLPGFSVQAGDPRCSTSSGASTCRGDGGPGYELAEQVPGDYEAGTLGMANGSQFFIALTQSSAFDDFTPFARVVAGLDVAGTLAQDTAITSIDITES